MINTRLFWIRRMNENELGALFWKERRKQGLTYVKLEEMSGVSRQHIAAIEKAKRGKEISAVTLVKLANALKVDPNLVMSAIGLIPLSDKAKLPTPDRIPIYKEFPFHAGSPIRPEDYFYRSFPGRTPKTIEAYIVQGTCMEPDVKEGDVIVVQRDGDLNTGDIIACRRDDGLHIGRLRKIDNDYWLENGTGRYPLKDCLVAAPVIEINRRLK